MKLTIDLINSRLFAGRVPLYHANAGPEMAGEIEPVLVLAFAQEQIYPIDQLRTRERLGNVVIGT